MKKGILFFVLVLLALQFQNCVSATELSEDYFDIASNYYVSNNYAKALEYIDLVLKFDPNNAKATELKSKILPDETKSDNLTIEQTAKILSTTQGTSIEIIDIEKKNIDNVIYDANYYNTKGQEFYRKKELEQAIQYFQKAIKIDKRNAVAYNNLAMTFWAQNNTAGAINYFKKSNSLNRRFTQPLVNLSMLYKQLGDEKNQICYLKKAIRLNCNDYLAYYWLGDYYKNKGLYPLAIQNYKETLKINQKFAPVYLNLALCFFETEEFNYCLLALNQYKEFCTNSDYAYYLASRANSALCRHKEAKEMIEKAILTCDRPDYNFELAKIDYSLGEYQNALNILQNLLKSIDSAEYFNYAGLCNYKLKNIEIAIANFNKAIDMDGLRPMYYYNLAQCYKSLGDKKNYVKYVNTATKINPISYQDFIDLSYIYYDNGNPGYALNTINRAISFYPDNKALYLSKLKIYETLGDNFHYNETKKMINERFNEK